jgi:hypothetical protein
MMNAFEFGMTKCSIPSSKTVWNLRCFKLIVFIVMPVNPELLDNILFICSHRHSLVDFIISKDLNLSITLGKKEAMIIYTLKRR